MPLLKLFMGLIIALCLPKAVFSQLQGEGDSLFQAGVAQILSTNYKSAHSTAGELQTIHPLAACVLQSMVFLAQFDDLGDTTAPKAALKRLQSCPVEPPQEQSFWAGVRLVQEGYANTILGNRVYAARRTRAGALILRQHEEVDARAFYAIYAYYINQLTSGLAWMPFVRDDRQKHLEILAKGGQQSRYFPSLFAASLIWMHYDRGEFAKALRWAKSLRQNNPQHPVFLQMEADMYFRLRNFQKALELYQKSEQDYALRAPGSVRWWSAQINLMRIHTALGQKAEADKIRTMLQDQSFQKLRRWMPPSLLRET